MQAHDSRAVVEAGAVVTDRLSWTCEGGLRGCAGNAPTDFPHEETDHFQWRTPEAAAPAIRPCTRPGEGPSQ